MCKLIEKEFLDGHASIVEWGESLVIDSVKENGILVADFSPCFSQVFFQARLYILEI